MVNTRIGFGFDVHRLVEGRPLVLGGIKVPHEKGILGHSDGDVLIHAICDALLGAANLRDIGYHFPDTSEKFKDINSKLILEQVLNLLKGEQYQIVNIDTTICLQRPKLKDFILQMQYTIAEVLEISPNAITIKATTTEGLGFIGQQEGISAYAVVLIEKIIED